jgi:hypothetical protein
MYLLNAAFMLSCCKKIADTSNFNPVSLIENPIVRKWTFQLEKTTLILISITSLYDKNHN